MSDPLGNKVIVACAPNGARRSKADHSALPITPAELAETARDVCDAGGCLLHLHVRDAAGRHSLDPDRYREAIDAIRAETSDELIIQITTESAGMFDIEAQMNVVRAVRPEAASCALRELCPDEGAVERYREFLRDCAELDVWVQHILYDADDARRFLHLLREGIIAEPTPFVLLVLGRYSTSGQMSDPRELAARALPFLDDGAPRWAVCAFGATEAQIAVGAAALGGHLRVGFENNVARPDGVLATSNGTQVQRLIPALRAMGRLPATAGEVRGARGLKS